MAAAMASGMAATSDANASARKTAPAASEVAFMMAAPQQTSEF
jgi:hypothetical protein